MEGFDGRKVTETSDLYESLHLALQREVVRDKHRRNLGRSFRRVPQRLSAAADDAAGR